MTTPACIEADSEYLCPDNAVTGIHAERGQDRPNHIFSGVCMYCQQRYMPPPPPAATVPTQRKTGGLGVAWYGRAKRR